MTGKDSKDLPYDLENMSIPELEALLQQDFIASNGSAPDVDFIMAVMEVIRKKEQAQPDHQPLDAEQAWEAFQSFYISEEGRANSIYRSKDENSTLQTTAFPQNHSGHKRLRWYLLVAALVIMLLSVTLIPVSGYANVVQMVIAYWTDNHFLFAPQEQAERAVGGQTASIPDEFLDLYAILTDRGVEHIAVPRYIPEELEIDDSVLYVSPKTGNIEFYIRYLSESNEILFNIVQSASPFGFIYEKDAESVEIYILGEMEYHIFSNNGVNVIAWCADGLEYTLTSSLPITDLKKIIDSIEV